MRSPISAPWHRSSSSIRDGSRGTEVETAASISRRSQLTDHPFSLMCRPWVALLLYLVFTGVGFADENDDDCTQYTITKIKEKLDSGYFTSVECVQQFLDKIGLYDSIDAAKDFRNDAAAAGPNTVWYEWLQQFKGYNHFTFINPEALTEAADADALRANGVDKPLLGVPISIKDWFPLIGFNNSGGRFQLAGFDPAMNDPIAQALIDAGAIVIGQNNMHEVGGGLTGINFAYGPARNAHDPSKVAGGSSGGGAAAVALKLVPAAIGNDIGGSIRQPPALNGVIGFRASLPRQQEGHYVTGVPNGLNLGRSMVATGPMTRSIDDAILLDRVMSVGPPITVEPRKRLEGVRIGVPQSFYALMEPEVAAVVEEALRKLEAKGATLVRTADIPGVSVIAPVVPFPGLVGPITTYKDLWLNRIFIVSGIDPVLWAAINIPSAPEGPDMIAQTAAFTAVLSSFPTLAAALEFYDHLLAVTNTVRANYDAYFANNQLDVIIYPTTNLPAVSIKEIVLNGGDPLANLFMYGKADFVYTTRSGRFNSITGHYTANTQLSPTLGTPSLSMPIGVTNDERLPVGMLIEGRVGDDATVLEVGRAFEHIFGIDYVRN